MKLELPITNKDIETLSTFNEMAGARDSRDSRDMDRLFINIGRNKGITPKDVVGAIADKARIQGKFIGDIDIHENYTFIEIPGKYAEQVIAVMQGNTIKGATISIEKSSGKGQSKKRGSRTYDSRSKSGSESRGPRRDDRRWTNKK